MNQLPIFHDDLSFRAQTEKMFREMEEHMSVCNPLNPAAQDFTSRRSPWSMGNSVSWWPFNEDNFFKLQPSEAQMPHDVTSGIGRGLQQSEILDDATSRALFFDIDPDKGQGQGRMFRMSFDVRQYDPADLSVRSEEGCLVVQANHMESQEGSGSKVTREFQRRIQLPQDVDPAKLTSTLSHDGILTIQAPVPPRYHAVVQQTCQNSGTLPCDTSFGTHQGSAFTPTLHSGSTGRASPRTALDPVMGASLTGRSRSPLLDNSRGFLPVNVSVGPRVSPVPFISNVQSSSMPGMEAPVISTDPLTGRRRMELTMKLGDRYRAGDVQVRAEDRRLTINAKHETVDQSGRSSTSTTQKQFDIGEPLDEQTVRATMTDDGKMVITGFIKQ